MPGIKKHHKQSENTNKTVEEIYKKEGVTAISKVLLEMKKEKHQQFNGVGGAEEQGQEHTGKQKNSNESST